MPPKQLKSLLRMHWAIFNPYLMITTMMMTVCNYHWDPGIDDDPEQDLWDRTWTRWLFRLQGTRWRRWLLRPYRSPAPSYRQLVKANGGGLNTIQRVKVTSWKNKGLPPPLISWGKIVPPFVHHDQRFQDDAGLYKFWNLKCRIGEHGENLENMEKMENIMLG